MSFCNVFGFECERFVGEKAKDHRDRGRKEVTGKIWKTAKYNQREQDSPINRRCGQADHHKTDLFSESFYQIFQCCFPRCNKVGAV